MKLFTSWKLLVRFPRREDCRRDQPERHVQHGMKKRTSKPADVLNAGGNMTSTVGLLDTPGGVSITEANGSDRNEESGAVE